MISNPLGSIAKIIAGQSPASSTYNSVGDGLPFFQGKADFQEMYPKVRMWCTSTKRKEAEPGDILISVRAPVGAVNICNQKSIIGRGLSAIRPTSRLDGKFLYYHLKANEKQIAALGTGSTFKAITQDTLQKISIPSPPIDEQKRIDYLLSKVEGAIAQRKQHLQQLNNLLKSVFLEMFGNPVRNDKGWEIKTLGKIASIERGRFSPRPRNDPKFYNGVHPFIQTGDISRSSGRLSDYTQTLNDLGAKVSKEFKVGTIVIAIVGATIGETAILKIATYAPDSVIGITPKEGDVATESVFIEYILRFWKPVLRAKAPEAARANINIETLRPLPIIWPQSDERAKFATIVQKVEGIIARYQQSLTDLESLFSGLRQKAFKGELDLSRVPLTTESTEATAEETHETNEQQQTTDTFELPAPSNLASLNLAKGRNALLDQWLTIWFERLKDAPFSTQPFMEAAQQRLWDLAEDNASEWGVAEYDYVRAWVFKTLDSGRLAQTYDNANNRVQLKAVSK